MTNSEFLVQEKRILELVREQYEADGFSFYLYPSKGLLPISVDGFKPDAIAISDEKKILIEVVSRKSTESDSAIKNISNILKSEPDWSLRIIFADSFNIENNSLREIVSRQTIQEAITRTEELLENDFDAEVLLLQWSILEAIVLYLFERSELNNTRVMSGKALISFLEQEGYLSFRDAKALRKLAIIRHRIAHGGLSENISFQNLSKMDGVVRSLFSEILD